MLLIRRWFDNQDANLSSVAPEVSKLVLSADICYEDCGLLLPASFQMRERGLVQHFKGDRQPVDGE